MISCSDEHCTNRYLERVRNAGPRYYPKAVKGILHQLRKIESDTMVLENVIQAAQETPILNPNELLSTLTSGQWEETSRRRTI